MRSKVVCFLLLAAPVMAQVKFEGHQDIGTVLRPGSFEYDAASRSFKISAAGENIWGTADGMHYAYKQMSGDLTITADITFPTSAGDPHKKAVLMIRQSLDPDSAYADAAVHLSGLTSLQSREEKGAVTHELQGAQTLPTRVRITKVGQYFFMSIGDDLHLAGGSMRVPLKEPFYVGIGVSAHNKDNFETAIFRNVEIAPLPPATGQPKLYSTLETISASSGDRKAVYVAPGRFEAPNWSKDNFLIFNGDGHLKKIPSDGGTPLTIETGFANRINNDHAISPDGAMMAISDSSQDTHQSEVYVVPIAGGTPRKVTTKSPSYFHGWSPDGKTLAFCGERNGNFDVYTIPAAGGEETRLTTAEGLDDGPEYSPDGKYIYFNSIRSGLMQIWRMHPDGSGQEQVTPDDGYNNWFAHVSPDNTRIVFITFEKDVSGHPANKDVMLRIMDLGTHKITTLAKLFGGQGTMNVPSWSPDGKRLAFVSYQLVP